MSKDLIFKHVMNFEAIEEDGETVYRGIASSTSIDRDTERLTAKALAKGAEGLMRNTTVFFNHKHDWYGVGKVRKSWADDTHLFVEFVPSKAEAVRDIVLQMDEGILKCMSVGGKIKKSSMEYDRDLKKDVRVIEDLEMFEVSVVGIGANPDASLTDAIHKAYDLEKTRFASTITDDEAEAKGGAESVENKIPIIPPVMGERMKSFFAKAEEVAREMKKLYAKKDGDSMTEEEKKASVSSVELKKETGVVTPNSPALTAPGTLTEGEMRYYEGVMAMLLARIKEVRGAGLVCGDTHAAAVMDAGAKGTGALPTDSYSEKSIEASKKEEEMVKKIQELEAKVIEFEKSTVMSKGLAEEKRKFELPTQRVSSELDAQALARATYRSALMG